MKRAKGATLDELVEATDWLPHTTRAACVLPEAPTPLWGRGKSRKLIG